MGRDATQVVAVVAAAVVGFYTESPQAALATYSAIVGVGNALNPPKGPQLQGPRLDDLSFQSATYGALIPRVYGTVAQFGNVFWLENNLIKETVTTESQGGKGGGGSELTSYSYSATFAVGLCKGPIAGIRRLWVGPHLIYDAGSSDISTIIASNQASALFTLYTGTETQLPDDRMQAALGIANTPAYRGLAYIVFKDFPLADYGNSLLGAQVKAEIVKDGGMPNTITTYTSYSSVLNNMFVSASNMNTVVAGAPNSNVTAYSFDGGISFFSGSIPAPATGTNKILFFQNNFYAICRDASGTQTLIYRSLNGATWFLVYTCAAYIRDAIATDEKILIVEFGGTHSIYSADGTVWIYQNNIPSGYQFTAISYDGSYYYAASFNNYAIARSSDLINWQLKSAPINSSATICVYGRLIIANTGGVVYGSDDQGASWYAMPACGTSISSFSYGNGVLIACGSNRASYSYDRGDSWTSLVDNNISGSVSFNDATFVFVNGSGAQARSVIFLPRVMTAGVTTLGSIVSAECLSSNLLTASDLDVTSLTHSVRGYRVSNVAAIRAAIEPLQGAFPFDVVQSGYKIKFKPRGGASVATIPAADLDARESTKAAGSALIITREMDSILPCRVVLKHMDVEREYDQGEQCAERLNTSAVNIQTIETAIVMTPAEAAGVAEVLLYLYWLERYDITLSLPPSYSQLEPADVVTVVTSMASYNLRLTTAAYATDGRLECSAKYNSAALYSPTALGVSGESTGSILMPIGRTAYELLDIPLLLDATDTPGFPAAMTGYLTGWSGGALFRTDDAGQTWTNLQSFTAPGAAIGSVAVAIGSGRTALMDTSSVISVYLIGGELSSVTESQMLSGSNHFAYGVDGRWEIIAAQNCMLQSDGSYLLSKLLRGRFGSEWACGLHQAGDSLVLLDSNRLKFITTNLNAIGLSRTYRGVTAGKALSSDSDKAFTYQGVNLECLAPVYLNGNRHPTTNDWSLTWIRRTRVGGEWRDYVDATLGEASESYEIDIYSSATYTTLKRTISGLTTPEAAYTSAQQVTDFGINQATLYVKVYQLSANVGRGYPLTTSITR